MTATLQQNATRTADASDTAAEPSVAVVEAVAEAANEDPLDLEPLYDTVDPDAIDDLVDSEMVGFVEFEYAGHVVTVHGNGTVLVEDGGA